MKRITARSITSHQIPRDILSYLKKKRISSTAAGIRITTSLALQLSTAVLQDSYIFCMSLSSKGNGDVVRTTISETFESLILELFFTSLSGDIILVLTHYLLRSRHL